MAAKAASISRSLLALSTCNFRPSASAAACASFASGSAFGLLGLTSKPNAAAVGTISCSNCSRFAVGKRADARDVSAWPVEAGDKTLFDRILADDEDDGNGRGLRFCRADRGGAGRENHGHPTANQISRQRGQPSDLTLRPAIFDRQ